MDREDASLDATFARMALDDALGEWIHGWLPDVDKRIIRASYST